MTNYQIKQMICEQIIEACENVIHDIELINFGMKHEDSDSTIAKYERNLEYHKGGRDALRNLYEMIQKEEENVQQLSIPDQTYYTTKSLDNSNSHG